MDILKKQAVAGGGIRGDPCKLRALENERSIGTLPKTALAKSIGFPIEKSKR